MLTPRHSDQRHPRRLLHAHRGRRHRLRLPGLVGLRIPDHHTAHPAPGAPPPHGADPEPCLAHFHYGGAMLKATLIATLALVGSPSGALLTGWLSWRRSIGTEQYRALFYVFSECVGKSHDSRRANFHQANEHFESRGCCGGCCAPRGLRVEGRCRLCHSEGDVALGHAYRP